MSRTIIVLNAVFDTVRYVLSTAALRLRQRVLLPLRVVWTYPILQRLVAHKSASLLDFRVVPLLLLRADLLKRFRGDVKYPFHLATVLST